MVFSGVHLRSGQVVLLSAGEHPSVYSAAHKLEKNGIRVVDIPLDRDGRVDRSFNENLILPNAWTPSEWKIIFGLICFASLTKPFMSLTLKMSL
mgnify:CR=1 FL=1